MKVVNKTKPPFGVERHPEPILKRNFVRNEAELYEIPRRPVSRYQNTPNINASMPPFGTSESESRMISKEEFVSGKGPLYDYEEIRPNPRRLKISLRDRSQVGSSVEVPPYGISQKPRRMVSRDQLYQRKNLSYKNANNQSLDLSRNSRPISRYQHKPNHPQLPPFGIDPEEENFANHENPNISFIENPRETNQSSHDENFSRESDHDPNFSIDKTLRVLGYSILWWHYRDMCRAKNYQRAKS